MVAVLVALVLVVLVAVLVVLVLVVLTVMGMVVLMVVVVAVMVLVAVPVWLGGGCGAWFRWVSGTQGAGREEAAVAREGFWRATTVTG